jgi:CRISPR/Cas system-associated protein Cas10 (large subunit of type III CRISPR-Cas system)
MRAFSYGIKEASKHALINAINKLVKRIETCENERCIVLHVIDESRRKSEITKIKLSKSLDGKTYYLPILPIVYGGDDITFICDGRLGISLAIEYIRNFEKETAERPDCRGKVTSCAGIAIVKSHYPFAQAYKLAEDLCNSAKNYRRKIEIEGSYLDWHFALSGFSGGIKEIREREYKVKKGWLTLRPVTLDENPKESLRAWPVIRRGIEEFRRPNWVGRRNKLKALREVLRLGPESVKQFMLRYEIKRLPEVAPSMTDLSEKGWHGDYCGYFDAIELCDWFIPLEEDD